METPMTAVPSVADSLMDAALQLAESRNWRSISLGDIARAAEQPLAAAYDCFPTKLHLVSAILARNDRRVLEGVVESEGETARERLFEVLMRRFDVLQMHKRGVAGMLRDLPQQPVAALAMLPRFALSMAWMLQAAGVSAVGIGGLLRTQAIGVIYLNAMRVWLSDDSADLARTMAALDQGLNRAEALVQQFPLLQGAAAGTATAAAAAPLVGPDETFVAEDAPD
jgi:AcrR family transcriptional regulator